jgi:predicted nuclease with RNAse H fold
MKWIGIDYGSKLAGTTVIAFEENGLIKTTSSIKNKDADGFIFSFCEKQKPECVFIDAPLSLPGVYHGNGTDYFYRAADKALKAMSPMFLGGLTARAMKLTQQLKALGIDSFETYPGALVKIQPALSPLYQKKSKPSDQLIQQLQNLLPFPIQNPPATLHDFDGILAWLSGHRYAKGLHESFGDHGEGVIVI